MRSRFSVRGRDLRRVAARLRVVTRTGGGWIVFAVLVAGLLFPILIDAGDEVLHVLARGFQSDGKKEELILVDLLALLSVTPAQKLLEDILDALKAPLIGFQLRREFDHHLPQHVGVVGQVVEVEHHYN